ncbi:MAG: SGNH/GDSL hydrolase family protein [Holophagales bacterium]|nr:SGNH/GDSL hydrolase family protein [Holophagales bacterium]
MPKAAENAEPPATAPADGPGRGPRSPRSTAFACRRSPRVGARLFFTAAAGIAVTSAAAAEPATTSMAGAGAAPPKATRTIVAFGDSISIGFREPGVDCNDPIATAGGYAEHLEEALAPLSSDDLRLLPRGICGERTDQGISRLREVLEDEKPDALILMEGTNDITSGNPPIGDETILDNLRLMAREADLAGAVTVYASIIPYGPGVGSSRRQDELNTRAEILAEGLEEAAAVEGRTFADPYRDLLAMPDLYDRYYHPDGYHLTASGNEVLARSFVDPVMAGIAEVCEPGPCTEDSTTLCLQDGGFRARAFWEANDTEGLGQAVAQSADTGKFWFFSPENIELVVKVLDGRCINDAFWVYYGSLSDVRFRLEVTRAATCARRLYVNPAGIFASFGDSSAFPADRPPGCIP